MADPPNSHDDKFKTPQSIAITLLAIYLVCVTLIFTYSLPFDCLEYLCFMLTQFCLSAVIITEDFVRIYEFMYMSSAYSTKCCNPNEWYFESHMMSHREIAERQQYFARSNCLRALNS